MSNATDRPGPQPQGSSTVAKVGAGTGTISLVLALVAVLPQMIAAFGGKPESVKPIVDTTQSVLQVIQEHPELAERLLPILTNGKGQSGQSPIQPVVQPVQPNVPIGVGPLAKLVATDTQMKEISAISGEVLVDPGTLLIISSRGSQPAPVPDSWDVSGQVKSQVGVTEAGYFVVPAPGEVIRFVLTVGANGAMSKAKLVVRSKGSATAVIDAPASSKPLVTVFESNGKPAGNLGLWKSLRDEGYACQVINLERDLNSIVADPMKLKALNAALTMPPPTLVVQTAAGDVTFAGTVPDSDGKIMEAITGIVEKQPAVLVAAGPASNGIAIYSDSLARIFGEAGDSFEAHKPETQIFDTMQAAIKVAPREAFAAVMAELGEVNAIRRTGTDAQKAAADIESAKVCRAYQSQFASVSSAIRGSKF